MSWVKRIKGNGIARQKLFMINSGGDANVEGQRDQHEGVKTANTAKNQRETYSI